MISLYGLLFLLLSIVSISCQRVEHRLTIATGDTGTSFQSVGQSIADT